MKEEELYKFYLVYLEDKLKMSEISFGKYSLMKISRTNFDVFKDRINKNKYFKNRMISLNRDKKINIILNGINK